MVGSVHSEMGMEEGFEPTKELEKGDHCGRWERAGIKSQFGYFNLETKV